MLIPLLTGIGIFLGFLSLCMFLVWKFEKIRVETEVFWQLVNILVDYPDIVWEDIELILETTSPNEPMRNFVRKEMEKEALVEEITRELIERWWRK